MHLILLPSALHRETEAQSSEATQTTCPRTHNWFPRKNVRGFSISPQPLGAPQTSLTCLQALAHAAPSAHTVSSPLTSKLSCILQDSCSHTSRHCPPSVGPHSTHLTSHHSAYASLTPALTTLCCHCLRTAPFSPQVCERPDGKAWCCLDHCSVPSIAQDRAQGRLSRHICEMNLWNKINK